VLDLIRDVVMGLEVELFNSPHIVKVEVKDNSNWFDFQLTTNQEFLEDDDLDKIFELVLNANLSLRRAGEYVVYLKYSFVGVQKYYVEDEEFDSLSSALDCASKQLDGDWLTEEGLSPYQLVEIREI